MRKRFVTAIGGLSLAACSGNGGQTSAPVVVAPGPTSSPSPVSSSTSTPAPTYSTYAGLTGNQAFKTACAALQINNVPPLILPATKFGDGFALSYTASTDTYALVGDGVSLSFSPAERDPSAPSTANTFIRTDAGVQSRLTFGAPAAAGVTLTYARGFGLVTSRSGTAVQYQCSYGIPTLTTDFPASTFSYTKVGFNGTVSKYDGSSTIIYRATNSVVTISVNPATKAITGTIVLTGNQNLAGGAFGPDTPLGTYSLAGSVDTMSGSYYGTISNAGGLAIGNFGGWFFGPQAIEAISSVSFADNISDGRITALANIAAIK